MSLGLPAGTNPIKTLIRLSEWVGWEELEGSCLAKRPAQFHIWNGWLGDGTRGGPWYRDSRGRSRSRIIFSIATKSESLDLSATRPAMMPMHIPITRPRMSILRYPARPAVLPKNPNIVNTLTSQFSGNVVAEQALLVLIPIQRIPQIELFTRYPPIPRKPTRHWQPQLCGVHTAEPAARDTYPAVGHDSTW
jgi:hypothetical protein